MKDDFIEFAMGEGKTPGIALERLAKVLVSRNDVFHGETKVVKDDHNLTYLAYCALYEYEPEVEEIEEWKKNAES